MAELVVHPALKNVQANGDGYSGEWKHLIFIANTGVFEDGKRWLHASVSRKDKTMPTYEDMQMLKKACIGEHRTALQIFPPKAQHIDIGGKMGIQVLHLWSCLDGDVTPNFGRYGTI